MAKKKAVIHSCSSCGYQVSKWLGKCPECSEWNTFEEDIYAHSKQKRRGEEGPLEKKTPQLINEMGLNQHERVKTGLSEFDRVVGGGLVPGSLILVGGGPGIGKSTLLTELMGRLSMRSKESILYVSGEESLSQIAERCRRLEVETKSFYVYNETNWQKIQSEIDKLSPGFLVLDSIQTIMNPDTYSGAGTISQIREVTCELMTTVKSKGITCFIVGHITKEGAIAGPKFLEHMVDTVVYFEGDPFGQYRLLRAIKNRFGSTNEVGIFEMRESGLSEVSNPSQYFLDENLSGEFGRSISCIVEGTRPLFVEIQALVVENKFGNGRRTTQGLDQNRLSMLIAVIEKYMSIPIGSNDIYLNIVGGIKITGRESDLSIVASLLSSYESRPLKSSTVFIGEVGLTGEVRSVPHIEIRLQEMAHLGHENAIVPEKMALKYKEKFPINLVGIKKIGELENYLER